MIPMEVTSENRNERLTCPFCESTDVRLESHFGSEIGKSRYYCQGCGSLFERLKWDGEQSGLRR